ncbi:hypothetical protein SLS62_006909 [Diatrype stigma]|uniref:SET domain-containing protein n=1 Tax=Diatrype stigma TaxID=117547 RepID=A0AAN9UMH1_9PEZI
MDPLEELITWATAKGVKLHGIKPARMPGRGVGIVATRQITQGDVLLEVPTSCLRTTDTVSPALLARKLPRRISVHGLLAADLALDLGLDLQCAASSPNSGSASDSEANSIARSRSAHAPWNAVCPAPADFATMPLVWPAALQALLPGPARELLAKQQAKLARDWADAAAAFAVSAEDDRDDADVGAGAGFNDGTPSPSPSLLLSPEDRYRHAWLLVNTRTFYYYNDKGSSSGTGRGAKRRKVVRPTDPDSCMCLQPVADLFNHDDGEGCAVAFDDAGYTVQASRAFAPGEEVRISYGRHPGDFLLVEYGFAVDDGDGNGNGNRWDEVALDDVVLPRLGARQKKVLEEAGFLGQYVLDGNVSDADADADGAVTVACYRTQVAVRLLCCGAGAEWRRFVDGKDDGAASQGKVDALLGEMLREYQAKAERTIEEVERLGDVGEPEQRAVLVKRWRQIRRLLGANIARLEKNNAQA